MEATAAADEIEKFKVEQGDVLITKDSETPYDIGTPAVVVDDCKGLVCGYHLALLKPNKDIIDPLFLSKQLASFETASYFSRLAAGSTRYGLSNGAIGKTTLRVPSFAKQRAIARTLRTVDQAIEKTEALIEKYQQIKAGLMQDLFTRGIGSDGQLRPHREQAPELYQETSFGWIPKDWHVVPLRKLISYISYGFTNPMPTMDDGPYMITAANIFDGKIQYLKFPAIFDSLSVLISSHHAQKLTDKRF